MSSRVDPREKRVCGMDIASHSELDPFLQNGERLITNASGGKVLDKTYEEYVAGLMAGGKYISVRVIPGKAFDIHGKPYNGDAIVGKLKPQE